MTRAASRGLALAPSRRHHELTLVKTAGNSVVYRRFRGIYAIPASALRELLLRTATNRAGEAVQLDAVRAAWALDSAGKRVSGSRCRSASARGAARDFNSYGRRVYQHHCRRALLRMFCPDAEIAVGRTGRETVRASARLGGGHQLPGFVARRSRGSSGGTHRSVELRCGRRSAPSLPPYVSPASVDASHAAPSRHHHAEAAREGCRTPSF